MLPQGANSCEVWQQTEARAESAFPHTHRVSDQLEGEKIKIERQDHLSESEARDSRRVAPLLLPLWLSSLRTQ